jgi:CheY-like chemotaxis protein
VDDEEIVLVALRETLRREGYEVITTLNAVEALKLVQDQTFSVILTDHQMPTLTGLEFLAQVRQVQPNATRILITAVLNLATVIDAINKGESTDLSLNPGCARSCWPRSENAVQRHHLICQNPGGDLHELSPQGFRVPAHEGYR